MMPVLNKLLENAVKYVRRGMAHMDTLAAVLKDTHCSWMATAAWLIVCDL